MARPKPLPTKPGEESVWDYPRPPRVEPVAATLRVEHRGAVLAQTTRGYRVLETSHPPVYYFPKADVQLDLLRPSAGATHCEWKGQAVYYHAVAGQATEEPCAWSYPKPVPAFAPLQDYVAFYAGRVDACYVNEVRVTPQPGNFYGGWITPDVVGPFKGGPGSWGW